MRRHATANVLALNQSGSIASFSDPPATKPDNVTAELAKTATTMTAASLTAEMRAAMGDTPTLRAEVNWCFNIVLNHHSLNSNKGISDIFKSMFPDLDITKMFICGKDKTRYIMRFGLAPYFKQQLVDSINKAGLFVLMFESLNQSTKKKQLDVHLISSREGWKLWALDPANFSECKFYYMAAGQAPQLSPLPPPQCSS